MSTACRLRQPRALPRPPQRPPAVDPPGGRRGRLRRRSLLVGGAALAALAAGGVTLVAVKPFNDTGDKETVHQRNRARPWRPSSGGR